MGLNPTLGINPVVVNGVNKRGHLGKNLGQFPLNDTMTAGYYWHLVCESRSVVSDSLYPRGLYSPWNSLGQNTGVGSLSLLQWIFLTQDLPDSADLLTQESTRGLLHCR